MLKPVTQRFIAGTTPGGQPPLSLDYLPAGYGTVALWLDDGATIDAVAEVTLDDLNDPTVTPRWFALAGAPTAASGYTRFYEPWRFIRLNITTITGNAEFKVAQSVTSDRTF